MSGLVPVCSVASSDFVSPVCPRRNPKGVHAKGFDRWIPASTRASGNRALRDIRYAVRRPRARVTAAGVKSWSFRFRDRITQAPLRVTIGRYPDVGLSAARGAADGYRKTVSAGGNPAEAKRGASGDKSFGALAERYLEEHARRRKRSHAVDQRNLKNHVLPRWKNRAYASIKRADVIELVEDLVSNGTPTLANRIQSLISTVFTFALDAGLVEFNPCHRLRKRGQENVGRRVLSDAERGIGTPGRSGPCRLDYFRPAREERP